MYVVSWEVSRHISKLMHSLLFTAFVPEPDLDDSHREPRVLGQLLTHQPSRLRGLLEQRNISNCLALIVVLGPLLFPSLHSFLSSSLSLSSSSFSLSDFSGESGKVVLTSSSR